MNAVEQLRAAATKERDDWNISPWRNSHSARVHFAIADLLDHVAGLIEATKEVQHGQTTILALAIAQAVTGVHE